MTLNAGTVYVDVKPDTSAMTSKGGRGLGTAMKTAGLLAATAFAASFLKGSLEEAKEAEKVGLAFADSLSRGTEHFDADALSAKFDEINNALGVSDEQLQTWATHFNNAIDFSKFGDQADEMLSQMTTLVVDIAARTGKSTTAIEKTILKLGTAPETAIPLLEKMGVLTQRQSDHAIKLIEAGKEEEAQLYAVAKATEEVSGQAAAQVTESEKMAISFGEIQEKVGGALLPVLNTLASVGIKVLDFLTSGSAAAKVTVIAMGLLGAAMLYLKIQTALAAETGVIYLAQQAAIKVATGIWTAAQWLLNAALTANPIGLIVAAIVALVAIIVAVLVKTGLLKKVWTVLLAVAKTVWNGIKAVVMVVFNFLKQAVITYFNIYKAIFTAVWNVAKSVWGKVKDIVVGVWKGIKAVWDGAVDFFSGIWSGIWEGAKSVINLLIGAWNALDFGFHFTIPDIIGVPHRGETFGVDDIFPDIPMLASGGVVTQPTLAMLGEAGPEAVIPLGGAGGSGQLTLRILDWRRGLAELGTEQEWVDRTGL